MNVEKLRSILRYDPETGAFTWLVQASNGKRIMDREAGNIHISGYRHIKIDGRCFKAHRLAFLWMLGDLPPGDVDHINGEKGDNRWANLRPATRSENMANKRLISTNTTGLKGVWFDRRRKVWVSQIKVDQRNTVLGSFKCPAAAHLSYVVAADKAFGAFARAA